jgi:hypothetical protein
MRRTDEVDPLTVTATGRVVSTRPVAAGRRAGPRPKMGRAPGRTKPRRARVRRTEKSRSRHPNRRGEQTPGAAAAVVVRRPGGYTPNARGDALSRGNAILAVSSPEGRTPRTRPGETDRGDRTAGSNASRRAGTARTQHDPGNGTPRERWLCTVGLRRWGHEPRESDAWVRSGERPRGEARVIL